MKNILLAEDDTNLRDIIADTLTSEDYSVDPVSDGTQAQLMLKQKNYDLVLSDVQMPGLNGCELMSEAKQAYVETPFLLMTAYGTIEQAVEAMRNGACDYLVKPFDADVLLSAVKKHIQDFSAPSGGAVIADGQSKKLFNLAARVAKSRVSVLICGESGVGKEVLARYIHQNSPLNEGPFVAINCAAIPENMLEAVLFGYEKGAFTGAYQRTIGKFELAQGGTLLLDEISEMDLALQAKLLRVLQEKEIERIGGRKPISLDVRVLATTNRDLRDQVASGKFREDLFYRLNVFPLTVLPLQQRIDDILPIAEAMLEKHRPEDQAVHYIFSEVAKQKLVSHSWPGNVRELENVIQRALVLCQGDTVEAEDLVLENAMLLSETECISDSAVERELCSDLKKHEQALILEALKKGNGSRKYAAETLGISPRTLRYKLSRMRDQGIAVPNARGIAAV